MAISEADALADLADLVANAPGISEVRDYESVDVLQNMAYVHTVGGTPFEFQFRVVVYHQTKDEKIGPGELRVLREQVETAMQDQAQFGPSQWTYDWIPNTDIWTCVFEVTRGREDF